MKLEKYTDPLDIAARNEQIATDDSIREQRKLATPTQMPYIEIIDGVETECFETTECEECGNEIGEKRLKVAIKNTLCIHCATAQERKFK